ncbi:hypothetical protein ACHAWF_017117 [Thalassiosira exigua]
MAMAMATALHDASSRIHGSATRPIHASSSPLQMGDSPGRSGMQPSDEEGRCAKGEADVCSSGSVDAVLGFGDSVGQVEGNGSAKYGPASAMLQSCNGSRHHGDSSRDGHHHLFVPRLEAAHERREDDNGNGFHVIPNETDGENVGVSDMKTSGAEGKRDNTCCTDIFSDNESVSPSEAQSEASMMALLRYMGASSKPYDSPPKKIPTKIDMEETLSLVSDAPSEASMMVLMRYFGCSSKPYMSGPRRKGSMKASMPESQFDHGLREGDHVIRWKMLGYCYPIQVHGIVFSAGPDFVTIVDCGLASDDGLDKAGNFELQNGKNRKAVRRRMNVLTLDDEKEIKKWTKIRYGEEVTLKVHSTNEEMHRHVNENNIHEESPTDAAANIEESPSAGLEMEEVEQCVQAKIKPSPEKSRTTSSAKSSWWSWSNKDTGSQSTTEPETKSAEQFDQKKTPQKLRLPKEDPSVLVLARLRFLLEYGGGPFPPPMGEDTNHDSKAKKPRPNLLPPNHLLYANSECIAVFCKTGRWSTLQASIFLHSSTVGNAKQTATLAMFLSAQTVTVPATGFWGFFGGTTTVGLFTAQPWLVPALVGGGMVYIGLPTLMLWKAKEIWADTEKRLNDAFWSMYNTDLIVELVRSWSGLGDRD